MKTKLQESMKVRTRLREQKQKADAELKELRAKLAQAS
jgi:hypothetical protein